MTIADAILSISTTVAADVAISDGIGVPMIVGKDVTLNGERVKSYAIAGAVAEAAADLTAGYIDQITHDMIVAFAGADPRTSEVLVVKQDAAGDATETVQDALDAAEALGYDAPGTWTIGLVSSRVTADHTSANDWLEADSSRRALFLAQSADGDWITASLPAGYGAWESFMVVYHDDDADPADAQFCAIPAGRDPERPAIGSASGRVSWLVGAAGTVPAYGTALTASQKAAVLANNANYHDASSNADATRILYSGQCLDGSTSLVAYFEIVAYAVVRREVAGSWLDLIQRGEVLVGGAAGRNIIESWTRDAVEILIGAGWVVPSEDGTLPEGYSIVVTNPTATTASVDLRLSIGDQIVSITIPITLKPVGA